MKTKFLESFKPTIIIIAIVSVVSVVVGEYFFPSLKGASQDSANCILGVGAFSVVPLTICLFGLTELNNLFARLARLLSSSERGKLSEKIDENYNNCLRAAFIAIICQTAVSLFLLFPSYDSPISLLCALINSILCVMFYGVFVCGSVRKATRFSENLLNKRLTNEERNYVIKQLE